MFSAEIRVQRLTDQSVPHVRDVARVMKKQFLDAANLAPLTLQRHLSSEVRLGLSLRRPRP